MEHKKNSYQLENLFNLDVPWNVLCDDHISKLIYKLFQVAGRFFDLYRMHNWPHRRLKSNNSSSNTNRIVNQTNEQTNDINCGWIDGTINKSENISTDPTGVCCKIREITQATADTSIPFFVVLS